MATASEHRERAMAAMLEASSYRQQVEGELAIMLHRARPHLVGWLAADIVQQRIEDHLSRGVTVHTNGGDRVRVPPLEPGEHLWGLTGIWRVSPLQLLAEAVTLDHETLMILIGPRCIHCNQPAADSPVSDRCPGSPMGSPFWPSQS